MYWLLLLLHGLLQNLLLKQSTVKQLLLLLKRIANRSLIRHLLLNKHVRNGLLHCLLSNQVGAVSSRAKGLDLLVGDLLQLLLRLLLLHLLLLLNRQGRALRRGLFRIQLRQRRQERVVKRLGSRHGSLLLGILLHLLENC